MMLQNSDDPEKDELLTARLQTYFSGFNDLHAFLNAYVSVLTGFSTRTALSVD